MIAATFKAEAKTPASLHVKFTILYYGFMNLGMCRQILMKLSNSKNSLNSFICFRLGTFGQTGKPQRI